MTGRKMRSAVALLVPALVVWAYHSRSALGTQEASTLEVQESGKGKAMTVQYLEIVTSDLEGTCAALEKLHGVSFGDPDPMIGNARTAMLDNGGRIGVRAPMAAHETPVIRPYVLVDDIEAAVKAAAAAGGEIAMAATEIPGGQGKFAIYFQGGIQYGLWEL